MNKWVSALFQPFSYFSIIIVFFSTIFPAALVALPFDEVRRTRISAPMWRLFSQFVLKFATLSKVYKRDERGKVSKSGHPEGLYIANHQSFVDIPLVISELPIPPIMKKEVLYIPVLGLCGYSAGAMIVDRKDHDSRKKVFEKAQERLTSGTKALMFYPEGTRNRKADFPKDYEEIKKPIIEFAYEKNIPVYSVSLYGTKSVLKPNSAFMNPGHKLGMIIREAKRGSDFPDADTFMQACWKDVRDGYFELQEKLT